MVTVPNGFQTKKYIVVGNPAGRIDIIEHGAHEAYKQLPIEMMHCSLIQGNYLFIGASNKLYLIDMTQEFKIISICSLKR